MCTGVFSEVADRNSLKKLVIFNEIIPLNFCLSGLNFTRQPGLHARAVSRSRIIQSLKIDIKFYGNLASLHRFTT